MSQCILYNLHVDSGFAHSCRKCVAENVATEMWKKNRISHVGQKHFIIAISYYTAEGFVERSLVLWISKAIHENKARITIDRSSTAYAVLLLVLSLFQQGFLYEVQHWYFSNAIGCLGPVNVTISYDEETAIIAIPSFLLFRLGSDIQ